MLAPQRCPVARLDWWQWIAKARALQRAKVKQRYCGKCQLWVWPDEQCDSFEQGRPPKPSRRTYNPVKRRT